MLKLPRNLVVADQGSDINIVYPRLVKELGLRLISIKKLKIPPIRMTVADGTWVDLKQFVILHVLVEGIKRKVWAFACPTESKSNSKAVALLLGVPYLEEVCAQIHVPSRSVEIGDAERGEGRVTIPTAGQIPVQPKLEPVLEDESDSTEDDEDADSEEETSGDDESGEQEAGSSEEGEDEDSDEDF
jgi:hypothetical protein